VGLQAFATGEAKKMRKMALSNEVKM